MNRVSAILLAVVVVAQIGCGGKVSRDEPAGSAATVMPATAETTDRTIGVSRWTLITTFEGAEHGFRFERDGDAHVGRSADGSNVLYLGGRGDEVTHLALHTVQSEENGSAAFRAQAALCDVAFEDGKAAFLWLAGELQKDPLAVTTREGKRFGYTTDRARGVLSVTISPTFQ